MQSHPPSLRLFDEITLGRLTADDVSWVIDRALKVASELNPIATTIDEPARHMLIALSEGIHTSSNSSDIAPLKLTRIRKSAWKMLLRAPSLLTEPSV